MSDSHIAGTCDVKGSSTHSVLETVVHSKHESKSVKISYLGLFRLQKGGCLPKRGTLLECYKVVDGCLLKKSILFFVLAFMRNKQFYVTVLNYGCDRYESGTKRLL